MLNRSEVAARLAAPTASQEVRAEFDDDDRLTRATRYAGGQPVPECWSVEVDAASNQVHISRSFRFSRALDDPECDAWVLGVLSQIAKFQPGEVRCSFCQLLAQSQKAMVYGPGVNICDDCVQLALEILIEADCFSRERTLPLLLKRRGTNQGAPRAF